MKNNPPRTTLSDVAKRAGVDPSLVSRVLNADPRLVIRPETRERVLAAARDLQYHPNAAAKSLRTAQSGAIGLLIPDFMNPVYAEIISGAERQALESGSILLVASLQAQSGGRFVALLASGRVDGLLVATPELSRDSVAALSATGRPIVSINQQLPGIDRAIVGDDALAAQVAVHHLAALGHSQIFHLRGPRGSETAKRRLNGFRQGMRQAGLEVTARSVLHAGYDPAGGAAATRQIALMPDPPTAIIVANVAAALGVLRTARELRIRVPNDLSVVAIQDTPIADNTWPPLTTVRTPLTELGRAGVVAALDSGSPTGVTRISDPVSLVQRESTAKIKRPR